MTSSNEGAGLGQLDQISMLCHTANHTRRYLEHTVLHQARLTWTSYDVLHLAVMRTPIDTGTLAAIAGLSKGTVTRAATTLIKRGLLRRDSPQTDRRRAVLAPTAQGWELNLTVRGQLVAEIFRLLGPGSNPGASELIHLRRLLANTGQAEGTDPTGHLA